MDRFSDVAKMLEIIPKFMGYFDRSMTSDLLKKLKKAEFKTLVRLLEQPGMPMQHYAKLANVEGGSFTYITDKLVKKGFIERIHDEDDKRKIILVLTETGLEMTNLLRTEIENSVAKRLDCLDENDLNNIQTASSILENILGKLENQ